VKKAKSKEIKNRKAAKEHNKEKHFRRQKLIKRGLAYMKIHDMALAYNEVSRDYARGSASDPPVLFTASCNAPEP
jgi:hypothetical protein